MVAGSRKRILREADGERSVLIIRRLRCEHCGRIHHELPDVIVPYKHHSAEAIEEILTEGRAETYPCEASTALRLRRWFSLLREYGENALRAILHLHKQDEQLRQTLSVLVPLVPASLAPGWLKKLVRTLVNGGLWPQTRFA